MELLRKAKNKIVEVAFGPSGEEFKIHQQTLAKLEVQINAIKAALSHYAKATVSLSAAACSAASEVSKFYADSKARAKSIKLFTDSNFKMEAIGEELFKDQYSRDILKPLDDWIDEIKQTKKLIQQAIQVSEQVNQQDEKVKSLAATKDKRGAKGQSLSNKEEQTAEQEEQRLEKYTKLYAQMKATIDKNVKGLTEGRYARFDACFVRLMECQVEHFRHGVSQTEGFLPNIENYRRRFPRKTPTVGVENGIISPPTSNSGPSVVIENVDAGFPDLSSPTASSTEESSGQDWDALKDTSKPGQSEEAARKRREERKKEAEAEARSAAAVKAKAEAEGKLKKDDSDIPTQDFLSGFSTGTIPPTPPSSGRGVKETRKKISVATEPTVPEDEGPASAPASIPSKSSLRPPQLNIFEPVDYTPDDNAPVAPALASPKSPLSPMIPSIDGLFIGADMEQPEFDLFNQDKQEAPSSSKEHKQGKKHDGIVPPTPPPSARGGRKGPGLDLSELQSQMRTLAVTSPHSSVVPPTPPPSARGTKPPLTGVLNLEHLENSLNQLQASQPDDLDGNGDGETYSSSSSSSSSVGSNRPDRTGSFDIDHLSEMFNSEDLLPDFTSPPSSNRGSSAASVRHGGLPSVLESFDPFTDETTVSTATNSSPTKHPSKTDPVPRKSSTPAPDPGLAGEIDDDLPASKSEKETRSAVEKFRDTTKAHEQAQEERRKASAALEAKLNTWEFKDGTQKNIRTLLNTLDTLLWEGSGWKKPSLVELSDTEGIRKVVRKARLLVHPDKVAQGTYEQQVVAERVFETLNTSFQLFEQSGQK